MYDDSSLIHPVTEMVDRTSGYRTCVKCGETKPLFEFYEDKYQRGYSKCKLCKINVVIARRIDKLDYVKSYDRSRKPANTERRKAARMEYERNNPEKILARRIAKKARRDGIIIARPCEMCSSDEERKANPVVEMHHDDYSKPLEVRFLCSKHHHRVEGYGSQYD